jgi:hypothetical protein
MTLSNGWDLHQDRLILGLQNYILRIVKSANSIKRTGTAAGSIRHLNSFKL